MDLEATAPAAPTAHDASAARSIYRHRLPVRVMHWVNVVCMTILLGSGLNIFNAHPTLYWGHDSVTGTPWLSIRGENTPAGPVGKTRLGSTDFDTTGVLGVSKVNGETTGARLSELGDDPGPQWLAMARHWHLFFAWIFVVNGLAYVTYTIFSRHLVRDLVPTRAELGTSAPRSSTTSGSGIRPAPPRRATTCCRA
jgi:thiosulfate reductase cytochrome b subunit